MDWQLLIVIAALAAAAGYLTRATWLTWFGRGKDCRTACGGCRQASEKSAAPDARRIALPQV